MDEIVVTKEGATKLFKGLNPSKALGPDDLHSMDVKELATVLIRTGIDTGEIPNGHSLIFVHFSMPPPPPPPDRRGDRKWPK